MFLLLVQNKPHETRDCDRNNCTPPQAYLKELGDTKRQLLSGAQRGQSGPHKQQQHLVGVVVATPGQARLEAVHQGPGLIRLDGPHSGLQAGSRGSQLLRSSMLNTVK